MFKFIRITILLFVLLGVGIGYLNEGKLKEWDEQIWVSLYPINGDGDKFTAEYITSLTNSDFKEIEKFIEEEAKYWKVGLPNPVFINLESEINSLPPDQKPFSVLNNILYSLQLRFWAWHHARSDGPKDIKILIVYFNRETNFSLSHSLGLERGKLGLVNAFASKTNHGSNLFIVAHELLHTLGARDKYNPETNQPIFPDGYANPQQEPLYPQNFAEIMGGRIPVSEEYSEIPPSLNKVVVRNLTAMEIGWKQSNSK